MGKKSLLAKSDTPQQPSLFRENALKDMNGLQLLQQGLQVVEAKSAAYLLAAFAGVMGMLLWGIWGVVEVQVQAHGILLSNEQIMTTEKMYQDDREERENLVKTLGALLVKKQMLYDKHLLTIDELERAKQTYLGARESLANNPRLSNQHAGELFITAPTSPDTSLSAIAFVSHAEGKKITAGMHVYVLPTYLSAYEYGYINGSVTNVSEYPVSKESVYSYLGNMALVDSYFSGGSPFAVKIAIEKSASTVSGLRWTTYNGAPFKVSAGSAVLVKIIQHQYHPYELIHT